MVLNYIEGHSRKNWRISLSFFQASTVFTLIPYFQETAGASLLIKKKKKNIIANFLLKCLRRKNSNDNMPQSSSEIIQLQINNEQIKIGKLQTWKPMNE